MFYILSIIKEFVAYKLKLPCPGKEYIFSKSYLGLSKAGT
jgi:hypothetical protein